MTDRNRTGQCARLDRDLRKINRRLQQELKQLQLDGGLTSAQALFLGMVEEEGPTPVPRAARALGVSCSAVILLVGRLHDAGLVARTRPSRTGPQGGIVHVNSSGPKNSGTDAV